MAVETPTGRIVLRIEADASVRPGVVPLPHGYGQGYPAGETRLRIEPRINQLTSSNYCDPIASTPYHKIVPVRLIAPTDTEVTAAEHASRAVRTST